jgi:hypothetical protein
MFGTILRRSLYWHVVWYELWSVGNSYPDISCEDAHVPPPRPVLKCGHGEEAHVKQSRYPMMAARVYYCCPYKSVGIILHLRSRFIWFQKKSQCHWKKLNFCRMRANVVSSSGSMSLRCGIHKSFFSRMIEVSLLRTTISSVGFPRHQIHLQWQMRKRRKQLLIVSATQHCANVVIDHSWQTRLTGWITLCFGIVIFHYR